MEDGFLGFEISVDEATYLTEHISLGAPLPEVLALYNPMGPPELATPWTALQQQRLTERGILTPTGVLPDVANLLRDLTCATETLAIRITPLQMPDTMLRIAIGRRDNRYVAIARTRDVVLAQPVPAPDWPTAAAIVLRTQLGAATPAALSQPATLRVEDVSRIAGRPHSCLTETLIDLGITDTDAAILNAASHPTVATELTAASRRDGTTRRTATAVTVLDTDRGRIIAWPTTGIDRRTWITYAEGTDTRLKTAVTQLLEQLNGHN